MVAPLLIGAAIGAGAGYLKQREELEQEKRQRKLAAALMRQSPWTGMQVDPMAIRSPSMAGNVASGALGGAAFGQSVGRSGPVGGGTTDTAGGMPLAADQAPNMAAMNPPEQPMTAEQAYTSPWNSMPYDPNQQPHQYGYGYPMAPGQQPVPQYRPMSPYGWR